MTSRIFLFSLPTLVVTTLLYAASSLFVFAQENIIVEKPDAPHIVSATHPNETRWYNSRNVTFSWVLPPFITAVRTLYDEEEASMPSKVYAPPIDNKSVTLEKDGVMYMHVQFKTESGWGDVDHYKFQVDTEAPKGLIATFPKGATSTSAAPLLMITAEDTLSGIDHIDIKIDGGSTATYPFDASNFYVLKKQVSGKHAALIQVYDKAGNVSETSVDYAVQTIDSPKVIFYTRQADVGSQFFVSGQTYPTAAVVVTLSNNEDIAVSQTVISDDEGGFTLNWKEALPKGVYEMRTLAIVRGVASEYSEARAVSIEGLPIVQAGVLAMNWLSLLLILIISGFSVASVFWYLLTKFSRFRRKVKRTLAEAENTLRTNVQALRRDTEEFHSVLVKAAKKRDLTKEEQTIMKKFKKRLDVTEKEIERKLEAIR